MTIITVEPPMEHRGEVPKFVYPTAYYISVILRNDTAYAEKTFRCINCGAIVFKYFSDVHIIFDGIITDTDARKIGRPCDILCRRCKVVYRKL
jgi:hypothetical protein